MDEQTRERLISELSPAETRALLYDWKFWARPEQLEPEDELWSTWLVMAGRGFGKTRTGAEWLKDKARRPMRRLALVAPTAGDARDIMVEGESGLLACYPRDDRPRYEPSKRRITWKNGTQATVYSADEPERLRGPQHHYAWADEIAAWKYPGAWDMLMFGMRLGFRPRTIATTTPKPRKFIIDLVDDPGTWVTYGSTYDNRQNLAGTFLTQIVKKYEGTTLGRQELSGELLRESPGALWKRDMIDALRVAEAPPLIRLVVAIDPAASSTEESDETGIVVAGKANDGHAYVLNDVSGRYSPDTWANIAIAQHRHWRGDRIVGEKNNGGDMIEALLRGRDRSIPYKSVWASRGKVIRAEPISALYEQGRVHHVGGFGAMEDEMCQWTPESDLSPGRMDALVWALTELMIDNNQGPDVAPVSALSGSSIWITR